MKFMLKGHDGHQAIQEVTEAKFRSVFGEFEIFPIPGGGEGYRIISLEDSGYNSWSGVEVIVDGAAENEITAAQYWEGAPLRGPEHLPLDGLPPETEIEPRADLDGSNHEGHCHFTWGGGSYYYSPSHPERDDDDPAYGPHTIWLCGVRCEVINGIGMLVDTNHRHFMIRYAWTTEPDPDPDPDPDPPEYQDYRVSGFAGEEKTHEWQNDQFGRFEVEPQSESRFKVSEVLAMEANGHQKPYPLTVLVQGQDCVGIPGIQVRAKYMNTGEKVTVETDPSGVACFRMDDLWKYALGSQPPVRVWIRREPSGHSDVAVTGWVEAADGEEFGDRWFNLAFVEREADPDPDPDPDPEPEPGECDCAVAIEAMRRDFGAMQATLAALAAKLEGGKILGEQATTDILARLDRIIELLED